MSAVHDPLQNPHVLAEAGPNEVAFFVLAEPVDVEDARSFGQMLAHIEPMAEIGAHVVATERQHGHGVAANLAHSAGGGGGGFRTHGGADVNAGRPVERLVYERHGGGATAAENERAYGHAFGRFPRRVDG